TLRTLRTLRTPWTLRTLPNRMKLLPVLDRTTNTFAQSRSVDLIKAVASGPSQEPSRRIITITDYVLQFSLVVYALFVPHGLGISEGGFLLGAVAWGIQLLVRRPIKGPNTPIDIALFGFFACCTVSAFFSYYPMGSLDGLRSQAFFFAFYFVS